jgi:hypothetical protein
MEFYGNGNQNPFSLSKSIFFIYECYVRNEIFLFEISHFVFLLVLEISLILDLESYLY